MLQTAERLNEPLCGSTAQFKRALILCHYPPAGMSGAPIIVRQLFKYYDPDRLDVLCCAAEYGRTLATAGDSLLGCNHTTFPNFCSSCPRPYFVFRPLMEAVNCLRLLPILRTGRHLIRERGIEAIFTATSTVEVNLAAHLLSQEFDLPLHLFETDDWEICTARGPARWLLRRFRSQILGSAKHLWLTSPNMVRDIEERFGARGEFLFHFVDVDEFQQLARREQPAAPPAPVSVVYTGAINNMFRDTMTRICQLFNAGLTIDGRPVHLTIHSHGCPPEYIGPGVTFAGFVPNDQIPATLARADVLLVAVSFSQDPHIQSLVRTSLYTKTVDYLASGRPVLVVSPPYSAEVDYFGETTEVVSELSDQTIEAALRRVVLDERHAESLSNRGLALVRERHSLPALERVFLHHFRETPE